MQLDSFYIIDDQVTDIFFELKPEGMRGDEFRTHAIAQALMATGNAMKLTAKLFAGVL